MKRSLAVLGAATLVALTLAAPPAQAAEPVVVLTPDDLHAAVDECEAPVSVRLAANIDLASLPADSLAWGLMVGCEVVLDLAGHTLTADAIGVAALERAASLRIEDSAGTGEVIAGEDRTEGSGFVVITPATLTIAGGTVRAFGAPGYAAIGGVPQAGTGEIFVTGGTVIARGGTDAPGIGGANKGALMGLTITGGVVSAFGGGGLAPGVGGGEGALHVDIRGGTLRAVGATAIDLAEPPLYSPSAISIGGTLEVEGLWHLPDILPGDEALVTATGLIRAIGSDPTAGDLGVTVTGGGSILNNGVIALVPETFDGVSVHRHNYLVSFVGTTGTTTSRVYATSMAAGYRSVPPSGPGTVGWNTAPDGSGTWFSPGTPLEGDLTVYAVPEPPADRDGDGVPDAMDVCPDSVLTGGSSTRPQALKPNNFWFTGVGLTDGKVSYTLAHTGGCTVTDIIAAAKLGKGHSKWGLSPGEMAAWMHSIG